MLIVTNNPNVAERHGNVRCVEGAPLDVMNEVCALLAVHGSTPEDAKARLDARKKKTVKTEPVADGWEQTAEPDSEKSDW